MYPLQDGASATPDVGLADEDQKAMQNGIIILLFNITLYTVFP